MYNVSLCRVQMEAENLDFFPMNRALSLTRETDDKTDSKLDELLAQVDVLVRNQREQVSNLSVRPSVRLSICLSICAVVSVG